MWIPSGNVIVKAAWLPSIGVTATIAGPSMMNTEPDATGAPASVAVSVIDVFESTRSFVVVSDIDAAGGNFTTIAPCPVV